MDGKQFTFELELSYVVGRVAQYRIDSRRCYRLFTAAGIKKKKKLGKNLLGMSVVFLTMRWG